MTRPVRHPTPPWRLLLIGAAAFLPGCASTPDEHDPVTEPSVTTSDDPLFVLEETPASTPTLPAKPGRSRKSATSGNTVVKPGDLQSAVRDRLPPGVKDVEGWSHDIANAFKTLRLAPTHQNLCAVLAVTEQESSFQADPPVAGLPRIVRAELARRVERYHIPEGVVNLALSVKSPDGRTYQERIAALRTEGDLNQFYSDMIAELPLGQQLFADYNPVRTGGPMQVSLNFARQQIQTKPYPYPIKTTLRDELFTRRGGLYFGTAYLLDYPATYPKMLYRFADFNAGRYACRNAAFQRAISQLSGQTIDLDGDLLRYRGDGVAPDTSETQRAILALGPSLDLSEAEIARDLRQEKAADFARTSLYQRVFALARQAGHPVSPAQLPEIRLNSPKITNGLTTARFAHRVNARYQACLTRRPSR